MLKLNHTTLICLSGLLWLAVGTFLLYLGLNFIIDAAHYRFGQDSFPMLDNLSPYFGGSDQAALLIIVVALFIGHLKGKHVLGKSVRKGVERILSFPNPTSITNIYSMKYYILLGTMVLLGVMMRFFPNDIRGFVDTAIGAALINGSLAYFRAAYVSRFV